ncbi:MAG: 4Fe-4S binding protein [Firmicutes bacterium]|nr:4Fe-4S binding protein [Bacillota bacterium]
MKKIAVVDRARCVACGACRKVCPRTAITMYKGCYAEIDREKCVGCGLCAKTCPGTLIEIVERGEV